MQRDEGFTVPRNPATEITWNPIPTTTRWLGVEAVTVAAINAKVDILVDSGWQVQDFKRLKGGMWYATLFKTEV